MHSRTLSKLRKLALPFLVSCLICSTALGVSIEKTNELLNSYRNNGGIHSGWVYFMDWFRMDAEDVIKERMETLAENNINVVVFSNNLLRYAHFVESEPYLGGNLYAPSLNEFRSAARLARDNNMIILYNFRFSDCVTALFGHEYRKVVDWKGKASRQVFCPTNEEFYNNVDFEVQKAIAKILKEENATGGFLYEQELYFTDFYPGLVSQKREVCFCDDCFGSFLKTKGQNISLPAAAKRYEWLSRNGYEFEYRKHLVDTTAGIFKKIRDKIHKIDGGFIYGVYPATFHWYTEATVRGFSGKLLPVIVYSATSYYSGYNRTHGGTFSCNALDSLQQNYFEKIGTNILYLGGLLPGAFWPNEFASEIVMMLRNTDGYWVHDMTTLAKPAKQVVLREKTPGMADFSCLDEPKVYWDLINKAHDIGSRTPSENRLTKTLHIITKPQRMKCVSRNTSKIENTQFTSDSAYFEIDDAVLCNNLPTFKFEPASPVQCKRALSIYRSIGKADKPGEVFGTRVYFTTSDTSFPAWVSIGRSYGSGLPDQYGTYYDFNCAVFGKDRWTPVEYLWKSPSDSSAIQYLRISGNMASSTIWASQPVILPLSVYKFENASFVLPEATKAEIKYSLTEKVFRSEIELVDSISKKEVFSNIPASTDIAFVRELIEDRRVFFRITAYGNSDQQIEVADLVINYAGSDAY